jgi:hypothetical protein
MQRRNDKFLHTGHVTLSPTQTAAEAQKHQTFEECGQT